MKNYAKLDAEIALLTGKQEEAFEELKSGMVSTPMMASPTVKREFHVTGDASRFCIDIILLTL